ncbi:MAG: ABC transporter ATP-binding protein [Clostridiales bacterium]|nr:ABC transporter ATP-binding protein [Clostridiales bacterium]
MGGKMFSNFRYLFSDLRKNDPAMLFWKLLDVLLCVLIPLLSTFFSSELVRIVTEDVLLIEFFCVIVFFSVMTMTAKFIQILSNGQLNSRAFALQMRFRLQCLEKQMKIEYVCLESREGAVLSTRAFGAIGALQSFLDESGGMMTAALGFLSYGAVISMLHPFVVIIMIIMTLVHYLCINRLAKLDFSDKEVSAPLERKIEYLVSKCRDFTFAKEIRLLALKNFLIKRFGVLLHQRLKISAKQHCRYFIVQMIVALLSFIQTALVYIYLISETIHGNITAAEFILYLGAITGFSGWIIQMIERYGSLMKKSLDILDLRHFLEYDDCLYQSEKVFPQSAPEIQMKNLSFSYDAERKVIDQLNMTIHSGERIALVGLNGAGKTTLVKLLCGLYKPYGGNVLFDGQSEISISDFSVVFQDIYLLPVSIAKNIALQQDVDPQKLQSALEMSGMDEVIAKLPEREQTLLVKEMNENAVELSGGERQKLAIARALYKDGSIMILDEPTAALDPISEDNIYRKFSEMTIGKTAIFISHRLASTRFCDRIFLLKDGKIAESGTHDQLMALKGEYANLYEVQSKYYHSKEEQA